MMRRRYDERGDAAIDAARESVTAICRQLHSEERRRGDTRHDAAAKMILRDVVDAATM